MRMLPLVCALLMGPLAHAENLCTGWEMKIEPDHQFQESDFTLESSLHALKVLGLLAQQPRHERAAFEEHNALTLVKGWLLKKAAVEAQATAQSEEEVAQVLQFCEFLINEAVIHD
ncbi:MAG: hypothetical protein AAFO81_06380 [Pseudomonadota bacterium]